MKASFSCFNTFDTYNLLHYSLLPSGFTVGFTLKNYATGSILRELIPGKKDDKAAFTPVSHEIGGGYIEYLLEWEGKKLNIVYASRENQAAICVTPLTKCVKPMSLCAYVGFLWGKSGACLREGDSLIGESGSEKFAVKVCGEASSDMNTSVMAPQICATLSTPVYIHTSSIESPREFIAERKAEYERGLNKIPAVDREIYKALEAAVAWNTIYEPNSGRLISGVSRDWNVYHGGYAVFCWDAFFSAILCADFSKELAYSNFRFMIEESKGLPFIVNTSDGAGFKTLDRSHPPVESLCAIMLYRKFKDLDFLREIYPQMKTWNEWFFSFRRVREGVFTWGSQPYTPVVGNEWEINGVGNSFGASLESGMDNSPLYINVPVDKKSRLLTEGDVGLTSLVLGDCYNLSEIASLLGYEEDSKDFIRKAHTIEEKMDWLWCEEKGMYLNRSVKSGEWNYGKGAVHFYPFFSRNLKRERMDKLLAHFYNPDEFYGDYMIASISKDDPLYPKQNYWQGRIWAPHNFLVYKALETHPECKKAKADLREKSRGLLLKEWLEHGHVHENYNADTGNGCEIPTDSIIPGSASSTFGSGCLYNFGGLLALVALDKD